LVPTVTNIHTGADVITLERLLLLLKLDLPARRRFYDEVYRVAECCFRAVEAKAEQIFDGGYYREILGGDSYAEPNHITIDLMWMEKASVS